MFSCSIQSFLEQLVNNNMSMCLKKICILFKIFFDIPSLQFTSSSQKLPSIAARDKTLDIFCICKQVAHSAPRSQSTFNFQGKHLQQVIGAYILKYSYLQFVRSLAFWKELGFDSTGGYTLPPPLIWTDKTQPYSTHIGETCSEGGLDSSLKTALLDRKIVSKEGMEADGCWFPEVGESDISQ